MAAKAGVKRLSFNQVIELRERAAKGESVTDLARAFNLTPSCVSRVVRGKTHTRVGGPRILRNVQIHVCGPAVVDIDAMDLHVAAKAVHS